MKEINVQNVLDAVGKDDMAEGEVLQQERLRWVSSSRPLISKLQAVY